MVDETILFAFTVLLQVKVWQPQNPITRLKVWLKFKEIQATWDPNIDQTEFVAGARYFLEIKSSSKRNLRGCITIKNPEKVWSFAKPPFSEPLS